MASLHISATPSLPGGERRRADFPPNIWEDRFLKYASNIVETEDEQRHKKLKEEVRMVLKAAKDEPLQNLDLIDAVQRLGVSYHFEMEIDELLQKLYAAHVSGTIDSDDLYTASLRFRLLRQQGYPISCDVFNKFKDDGGMFQKSVTQDAQGMLSLFEAAHFRVHDEDILDEAFTFTSTLLPSLATQLSPPLSTQIRSALRHPLHKFLNRLEARRFMSFYPQHLSHCEVLLFFAKLDFNILQKQYQKELSDIQRWWNDLEVRKNFPFARDRVVECYFWMNGLDFHPDYALGRRILTKVTAMTSILDDIFDVHGTVDELELLTQAIERWDISEMNKLPDYMKVFYKALLDVYTEIEENMAVQEKSDRIYYGKEVMKRLTRNYLVEAKWFHRKYVPTMEEYMAVASISGGYENLAGTSYLGFGDIPTKDAFEWILNDSKMMKASSKVSRLVDDIATQDFEQKRGHVASCVQCYEKQFGVTTEEAVDELNKQILDGWKDINEECLSPTQFPMQFLMPILNLTRVLDIIYKDGDGYTFSALLKDDIGQVFLDPVPM